MSNTSNGKLMDATEVSEYLDVTRNMAYTLLHRRDFPTVQIGGRLYAIRGEVDRWIEQQAQKGGYIYEQEESTR